MDTLGPKSKEAHILWFDGEHWKLAKGKTEK